MLAYERSRDQAIKCTADKYSGIQAEATRITVRAVRPSDVVLIQEMHDRLSRQSIYYRYLGPNKPSTENLQRLCSTSNECGAVLVATVTEPEEKIVAIACYRVDSDNPSTAEPAIIVEDSYQGCGLGKKIMFALCQNAIRKGLETFDTFIDPNNQRVLRLIQGSGMHFESRFRDGLKRIRIWLMPFEIAW